MTLTMKKTLIVLALAAIQAVAIAQDKDVDWAWTGRYAEANAGLTLRPRVVLFGDSITDSWPKMDPDFFKDNNFAGRGISGQTTAQILARMQQDVVSLKPKYVVILCGINDIAHNPGYAVDIETAIARIKSMCDIARANKIRPVLCTLLPSSRCYWRPSRGDIFGEVKAFNERLRKLAADEHIKLADYFYLFSDGDATMPAEYSKDTVHPNIDGYKIMEECIMKYIHK